MCPRLKQKYIGSILGGVWGSECPSTGKLNHGIKFPSPNECIEVAQTLSIGKNNEMGKMLGGAVIQESKNYHYIDRNLYLADPKQVLKWCLGSTKLGAEYGAISAMSFNKDCTRLLSGFARGQVMLLCLLNTQILVIFT